MQPPKQSSRAGQAGARHSTRERPLLGSKVPNRSISLHYRAYKVVNGKSKYTALHTHDEGARITYLVLVYSMWLKDGST
jgi:hypothetical protein